MEQPTVTNTSPPRPSSAKTTMSTSMTTTTSHSTCSTVAGRREREGYGSGPFHPASSRDGCETRAAQGSIAAHSLRGDRLPGPTTDTQRSISSETAKSARAAERRACLRAGASRSSTGRSRMSSSRSIISRRSTISRRPPNDIYINPTSINGGRSVRSSSSTSMYTSSSYSTPVITALFDLAYRDDLVKFHTDRFICMFDLLNEPRERILMETDLRTAYLNSYNEGQVQAQISMENTFNYHVELLSSTFEAAERLRGGNGAADNNLNIDAVVPAPVNDARNNRAIARAAQRNAAPDDDPGNDDSDDEEDDDGEPGRNPGNPGDNNGNAGDDNDAASDGDEADDDGIPRGRPGPPRRDERLNGGPPPGGGADEPDGSDDEDDEDDDEPGDYRRRAIVFPRDIGADAFVYDDQCRLVRRALWLSEIPDRYHAAYFAQAGITTFARLAECTFASWTRFQTRLEKRRQFTVALDHQIKALTVLSLWVNTKIVHGSFRDVNSLTRRDVLNLVRQEGCVEVSHTMVKPTKLSQQSEYPAWKKQMRIHLDSTLNKEFLRLSYIIRPSTPPTTFHSLTHELESVITNDGSTAESRRDSKMVYKILLTNTVDKAAKSYMEDDNDAECGRKAWFSIESLYEGSGNNERKINEIQAELVRQSYTMNGYGSALSLTKRLFGYYKDLAERGAAVGEVDKLRHLRRSIKVPVDDTPWFLNKWTDAVDETLQERSDTDLALTFVTWTTKLVNGEETYRTDNKSNSRRVSSASTGGEYSDYGGAQHRDHDATTGMPLQWRVSGIDITIFYGNAGKVGKQQNLPRVTKSWFEKNPDVKCPPKFRADAKAYKGSSGNAKQQKSKKKRERKIAAAAAAEVVDDDSCEMLASSSPN